MLNKKYLFIASFAAIGFATSAIADDSAAVYFAKQAGVIAGAAEACGQPISIMVMRTGEVIDALVTDPMDKTYATAAFETTRQKSHDNLIQSQQITCPKVITDFNNLPLLQPDYRTTVLQPLLANKIGATPSTPNTSAGTTTAAAAPAATSDAAAKTKNTAPTTATPSNAATNQILPATTAPAQNYVNGNNTNVTNANLPPINPAYVPPGTPLNPTAPISQNATEAAKLQLAQQLAQMAQTLVNSTSNNQAQVNIGAGQISPNNALYNPALNAQLNGGEGANNPIFTGEPLGNK